MAWKKLGNGCDKTFYADGEGFGGYGAICCSQEVAERELGAHAKLSLLNLSVIPDIKPWPENESLGVEGEDRIPRYKIQRLALQNTFKPIMCVMEPPKKVKTELKGGKKAIMLKGLKEIKGNLDSICKIVGELTLAVDATSGGVYLLDFGPGAGGSTASCHSVQIGKGLDKIITEVEALSE